MARPDSFQLKSQLESAHAITILLPQNPHFDLVASALGLKIALETANKSVAVLCPSEMTVEFNRLVGVDSVSNSFGSRNLVITFPGQTEMVDKVSYNLEKGELQLVISPKTSAPDLDYKKLKFVSGTKKADLILLIGVSRLSDLGQFYTANKDFFTSNPLVSLTLEPPQDNYTNIQLFDSQASSLCEVASSLLDAISYPLNLDAATNLLSGLEIATDQFSADTVTPATFETAARLLRAGAVRQHPLSPADYPPGSIPEAPQAPPRPSSLAVYGTDSQSLEDQPQDGKKIKENPDWYEPKIYQGSMLP